MEGAREGIVEGLEVGMAVGSTVGEVEGEWVASRSWSCAHGMVRTLFQSLVGKVMVTVSHPPPSASSMQCGQSIHLCSFSSYSTPSTIMCPMHNWSDPGCTICTL